MIKISNKLWIFCRQMGTINPTGGNKRIYMICWVLAALLAAGYNGSELMALLNAPIPGRSMDVRRAIQKRRQLEEKTSAVLKSGSIGSNTNLILLKSGPDFNQQKKKVSIPPPKVEAKKEKKEIILPSLTGVMRTSDVQGNLRAIALIGGKRLGEQDIVQGFRVQKITPNGVVLTKQGAKWFVPVPEVHFSRNQIGQPEAAIQDKARNNGN
jgi:hypothetical protein